MRKKSSFYHVRFNKVGINAEIAAEVLGVSVDEVLRFDDEGSVMAEKLLLAWSRKHVGLDGWDGFYFSRGVLRYKRLRWTSGSLLHLVECANENTALKREINELKTLSGSVKSLYSVSLNGCKRFVIRLQRF